MFLGFGWAFWPFNFAFFAVFAASFTSLAVSFCILSFLMEFQHSLEGFSGLGPKVCSLISLFSVFFLLNFAFLAPFLLNLSM